MLKQSFKCLQLKWAVEGWNKENQLSSLFLHDFTFYARPYCDSSLSTTCHNVAIKEIHNTVRSPQSRLGPPAHSATQSSLCSWLGWVLLSATTLLWKQPNLKYTLSGKLVCKYTLLNPLLNPSPTLLEQDLWGNLTPFLPLTIIFLPVYLIRNTCTCVFMYLMRRCL